MLGSLVKCSERQVRWWVDNINRGRQVSGIWTAEVEPGSDEREPYPPYSIHPDHRRNCCRIRLILSEAIGFTRVSGSRGWVAYIWDSARRTRTPARAAACASRSAFAASVAATCRPALTLNTLSKKPYLKVKPKFKLQPPGRSHRLASAPVKAGAEHKMGTILANEARKFRSIDYPSFSVHGTHLCVTRRRHRRRRRRRRHCTRTKYLGFQSGLIGSLK